MLKILLDNLKSFTKSLELYLVLKGIKPLARISVRDIDVEKISELLNKLGLIFETSVFKVKMSFGGFYSTKGIKLTKSSSEKGHFFFYISRHKNLAEKARKLEETDDVIGLGKVLGYPDCCVEFFSENRQEEQKKGNDYVVPAIENSKKGLFPIYLNIFSRYFDTPLLFHCPCSFNCEKSIELAKKHLKAIEEHDKKVSEWVIGFQKAAVIYVKGKVYYLPGELKKDEDIFVYNKVLTTSSDFFYNLLNNDKKILLEKDGFKVLKRKFNHPLLIFS